MNPDALDKYCIEDISLDEKSAYLDQTNWIKHLQFSQVEILAKYFTVYELPPKTKIIQEGQKQPPFMGLIISGTANVLKLDQQENSKLLCTLNRGKTFGEMSLVDSFPVSATVVTNEQTKLMVLRKYSFQKFVDDHPRFGNVILLKLAQLMSHRLRKASGQLVDFLDLPDK